MPGASAQLVATKEVVDDDVPEADGEERHATLKRVTATSNMAFTLTTMVLFVWATLRGELGQLDQLAPSQGGPLLREAHRLFMWFGFFSFTELVPIYMGGESRLGASFHTIHHILRAITLFVLGGAGFCSVQAEISCALFCLHQTLMKLTYDLKLLSKHVLYQNFLFLLYGFLSPHRATCYVAGYIFGPLGDWLWPLLAMEVVVTFGFATGYPHFVRKSLGPYCAEQCRGQPRGGEDATHLALEVAPIALEQEALELGSVGTGSGDGASDVGVWFLFGMGIEAVTGGTIYQRQLAEAIQEHGAMRVDCLEANSTERATRAVVDFSKVTAARLAAGLTPPVLLVDGMAALYGHEALLGVDAPDFSLLVHWPFAADGYSQEPWLRDAPGTDSAGAIASLEAQLASRCRGLICNSPSCADAFRRLHKANLHAPLPEAKVHVVSPILLLRPPPLRATYAADADGAVHLVTVGTVSPRKNTLLAIRAAAATARALDRTVRLHVVGDRSAHAAYVAEADAEAASVAASEPRVRVVMHGRLADDALHELLAMATGVVCLSSHEGFGMAPVEMALAAVPVVTTRVGHIEEMLHGASACTLLSAAPDEVEVASALVGLAQGAAPRAQQMVAWVQDVHRSKDRRPDPAQAASIVRAALLGHPLH